MADNPRPEVTYAYTTQKGEIIHLSSKPLYAFLLSLFKRLGGGGGNPDLNNLYDLVAILDNTLSIQQEQLTSLSDDLITGLINLQNAINNIEPSQATIDTSKIYSVISDMNVVAAANADAILD